ncbi:MAG: DUF2243 domain-containing protein [Nocardioidaceae bacterium]
MWRRGCSCWWEPLCSCAPGSAANDHRAGARTRGLLCFGWGLFNVAEGIVNHQILGVHHVRDDLGGPLSWDLGFLALGLLLMLGGLALHRADRTRRYVDVRS